MPKRLVYSRSSSKSKSSSSSGRKRPATKRRRIASSSKSKSKSKSPKSPKVKSQEVLPMTSVLQNGTASLNVYNIEGQGLVLLHKCYETKYLLQYHPPIVVFGKVCQPRRSVGFFSDVVPFYTYSNKSQPALPMTPELKMLLNWVNSVLGSKFNAILVNLYENGDEYISAHSDDEGQLDPSAGVVAMNLGATRTFRIHEKLGGGKKKKVFDYQTKDNEMLQMAGTFQSKYYHEIPKEKNKGERISFTFRYHKV